jgi:hypothetical protein
MGSDPGGNSDDGDPGGSDIEGRKTRFVPRTDVVDRSAPTTVNPAAEPVGTPVATPAGTVIGRTRLMGDHGQSAQGSGVQPATPTKRMGQAKTEYVRGETFESEPVAGWVVVVKGPGRGGFRPVFVGMNTVGRDPSQRISLSFGDDSISREEHAFITYDEEQRCFYLQHGGKSNLVRLGNAPVLSPVELKENDLIRIGRTTLRFVPCCGADFSWSDEVADA